MIDATNDVDFADGPRIASSESAGERIAAAAPGARVVKALNTVGAEHLSPGPLDHPTLMPVCGDDAARELVMALARDLHFEALDAGPLRNAAMLEQRATLWMWAAVRAGRRRAISFALLDR